MQIFEFASEEAIEVAANGGTIKLPFTTTVEEVTVTENADWLKSAVAVKGFQTGNVTLVATANEGEEARTAVVTVSGGEGKSVSFTLTQPAIYRGFLNDENGDPIQWEETFGVYTSEDDANAANVANATATHKNVFTIELSDDYTKGTYLVSNIFKAAYYSNNGQPVYNKGGQFYANYKDGKFTLLYANSVNCYGFTSDVTISYDETAKIFSAAPFQAYDYSSYKYRYIGGYAAVVKVEEPVGPSEPEDDPIAGTWDVTCNYGVGAWGSAAATTGTMLITKSSGTYTIEEFLGNSVSWELTQDGITFTVKGVSEAMGPGKLVLTYDESTMTLKSPAGTSYTDFTSFNMSDVVATKQGGATPEVPADPWEASGVVTLVLDEYMFDDYPQYCALTELKAYADETNLYARLKTTKSSGAARLRFCTADTGEGTETVWYWEKSFYATPLYKSEKVSIDSDFNFSLSYNGTPVALETTIDGDDVYWVMTIPRSAHDHTKNAGSVNIGFLTYNSDGAENGFMPRVWSEMMEVTLP